MRERKTERRKRGLQLLCVFQVKLVMPEKEKDVLELITRRLDKQENETLPQVDLNSFEVCT